MRLKNRHPKVLLIGTGAAFIAGGIDCFENDLAVLGFASLVVAVFNIGGSFFLKRYPFSVNIVMLLVNAAFSALSACIYFISGRDSIQYGWAAVAIISLIAAARAYKKMKASEKNDRG